MNEVFRVPLYGQIHALLSLAYTPEGEVLWWRRARRELGYRTPSQAWDDGDKLKVYRLARSAAEHVAT